MRFLTFIKKNLDNQEDEDLKQFAEWIFRSAIGKNNPHAGVPQIEWFMNAHDLPDAIHRGFSKWCIAYFHEPKNMLPDYLKAEMQTIMENSQNKNIIQAGEVVYFEFVPVSTIQEGEVFLCVGFDHASGFCFNLGVAKELNDKNILQKIQELLDDENFRLHDCPFELVMYRSPHLKKQITKLLEPAQGKVIFDEERFFNEAAPFITDIFSRLNNQVKKQKKK